MSPNGVTHVTGPYIKPGDDGWEWSSDGRLTYPPILATSASETSKFA
jgi:hypothetical protein